MHKKPNPAQSFGIPGAALLVLVSLLTASAAGPSEPIHHFKIEKPDSIFVGDKTAFVITARLADDSIAELAKSKLNCSLTASSKTETQVINLNNGQATFTRTFDKPAMLILSITDKSNTDLMGSVIFQVRPNLTPVKEGK